MGMRLAPVISHRNSSGPKKTRKVGLKSHEGCKVCKKRHLKCGEEKPVCKRCANSGWDCEYESQPILLNRAKAANLGKYQSQSNSIAYSPSVDITGNSTQRRSFHYFRSRKVATVPGNFEPYLWDHLVLQMSHKYPTIQQSLFALSALYEEHSRSPGAIYKSKSYSGEALSQYNIAIKSLVQYLSSSQPDPRATLVSCLIFVWIEFLQSRTDLAFGQVRSGLRILSQLVDGAAHRQEWFHGDAEDLLGSLTRSFTRLEIQAAIHGTSVKDPSTKILRRIASMKAIPASFEDISASRNCLDGEINTIYTFVREVQHITTAPSVEQVTAFNNRRLLLQRLEQWRKANMKIQVTGEDSSSIAYLYMYYHTAKITLQVLFTSSEMAYDEYTPDFENILHMASQLVESTSDTSPVLSFDIGVMPPLSFVVMKCRVLRLRRQAIALLRIAPGQEGMWCRETMLKYCEWKVTLEEQGRGDLSEDELLPELARVPVPYPQGIRSVADVDPAPDDGDSGALVRGMDDQETPARARQAAGERMAAAEQAFESGQNEDMDAFISNLIASPGQYPDRYMIVLPEVEDQMNLYSRTP